MRGCRAVAAWLAIGVIALSARASDGRAQNAPSDKWHYTITPYAWFPALEGKVGVGPVSSDVDLSAGEIIRALNFGIMGTGEARKGSLLFSIDGVYSSLGQSKAFAVRGDTGRLELTQKETIIQPVVGLHMGDMMWSFDLLGGARYWNLNSTLDVDRTRRPSNQHSASQQWVDWTGGLRFSSSPALKFRFVLGGDLGGGGSVNTWQAYSSLGYDVWSRWTLALSYRQLDVNYESHDFLFDTRSGGFVFGATYRTW